MFRGVGTNVGAEAILLVVRNPSVLVVLFGNSLHGFRRSFRLSAW